MKKYILYGIVLLSALGSCRKEIKSKQGGIDLISNIYINASKNLEDTQSFHISRLNYSNDTIIELVPNIANPLITDEIHFIKDSLFYSLGTPVNAGTHAGRRTFISNALSLGIPPQVVMKWTGHDDYKSMKPYIDIADETKINAMEKFNQLQIQ